MTPRIGASALTTLAVVALLPLAPAALAANAKAPSGQYLGTVAGGGKFVVDIDGGVVDTVQAEYPFACTGGGRSGDGELLLENLTVKVKRTAAGTAFTVKIKQGAQDGNPAGTIKGTWSKSAGKVTGTITLAASAYAKDCLPGTPGKNGPVTFSATRQPS